MTRNIILTLLLIAGAVLANPEGVAITRLADGAPPLETYAEYLTARPAAGNDGFEQIYEGRRGSGDSLYLLINSTLYPQITAGLATWIDDLEDAGYTVSVYTSGIVTPEVLRAQLQGWWSAGMDAVVLVGQFDSAWFQGIFWTDIGYEEFPCDLFLTDLDGSWADLVDAGGAANPDGIYDEHTDGSGDMEPDIYFGRLTTYNLPLCGGEAELVNAWLTRNHEWRSGDWDLPHTALTYIDHDWAGSGPSWTADVRQLYATTEMNYWPDVTADGYRSRLQDNQYEHILMCCHSSPTLHAFNTGGTVNNYFVNSTDHEWVVHNLFACSNARYTTENNMGAVYAMDPGAKGLISIGSTKTGSMLEFDDFYGYLAGGMNWGEALWAWMSLVAEGEAPGWTQQDARGWFYGMTLIGDPTLAPSSDSPVEVADFRAAPAEGGALVSWSICSCSGISGVNLYRLEDSTRVRLNSELLPASSGRYLDREVPGSVGSWLLEVVDDSGETVTFGPTECEIYGEDLAVSRLAGVYPNPVTGPAAVSLELAGRDAGRVELALYDTAGRRVATVYSGSLPAGHHTLALPSENLAAGVYLLQLQTAMAQATARVLVSR